MAKKSPTIPNISGAQARAVREKSGKNQSAFWAPLGITQSGGSRWHRPVLRGCRDPGCQRRAEGRLIMLTVIAENPVTSCAIAVVTVVLLVAVGHWIDLAREKDDEDV